MSVPIPFASAGRIPSPGDNVAIATRRLEAGTTIRFFGSPRSLGLRVLLMIQSAASNKLYALAQAVSSAPSRAIDY